MKSVYLSWTRVLPHASTSLTVERNDSCVPQMHIWIKCKPVGTSNSMFMTSSSACPLKRHSCPRNLPLNTAPIPANGYTSGTTSDPDIHKLSNFGSCTKTSRTRARETVSILMVKEVTDRGSLPNEGIHDGRNPPGSDRVIACTFVNHGVCSEKPRGALEDHPSEKCKSLT